VTRSGTSGSGHGHDEAGMSGSDATAIAGAGLPGVLSAYQRCLSSRGTTRRKSRLMTGRRRAAAPAPVHPGGLVPVPRPGAADCGDNPAALAAYAAQHGHAKVPRTYVTPAGIRLSARVRQQRQRRRHPGRNQSRPLTAGQIAILDQADMIREPARTPRRQASPPP
jgi:hypothetical protein